MVWREDEESFSTHELAPLSRELYFNESLWDVLEETLHGNKCCDVMAMICLLIWLNKKCKATHFNLLGFDNN